MLWRLVPAVRPGERRRFLSLALLYGTIFAGLTLGLAGAEALLLARLGVEALPPTLVAASVSTFLGSLGYAAVVGRIPHDRLLVRLLLGVALLAGAAAPAAGSGPDGLLPVLYCLYTLSFFLLVNHFWTYAAEAFDPLAAKRVFPLLGVGAGLGGLGGGSLAALVRSPGLLLGLWAAALVAASLQVRRLPGSEAPPSRRPLEEMAEGWRFLRGSALARSFAVAVVGMVVATSLLQYLYSDVFARAFPTPDRLAAFLGGFMAAANLVELGLSLAVTPRLLARLGVPGATLVHPVTTLASFGGLALAYTVPMAALAWMDRKTLQGGLAAPLRTLAYNALPDRHRGRVRAVLEGFLVYVAATAAAGVLTLLKGHLAPGPLCAAGALFSLLYLAGAWGIRREYLKALADQVTRGGEAGTPSPSVLPEQPEDAAPEARAAHLESLGGRAGLAALDRALDDEAPAVRRAALAGLRSLADPLAGRVMARALADRAGSVRRAAVEGLALRGAEVVPCVEPYLHSRSVSTVEAAMDTLAALGALAEVGGEMRERVRQAWRDLASLALVEDPFLACALQDRADREGHLALHAMELLEDPEVVRAVRRAVAVASARSRAGALELLSNMGDRTTAALLVLLLEEGDPRERLDAVRPLLRLPETAAEVLEESRGAADPWVRMAAAALRGEGSERAVAMERLLLLESTPPLDRLTLEDQEGLESDLVEERFARGEWLFQPGDPADRVYVVAEGEVDLVAPDGTPLHRFGPCTFVGELALAEEVRETGARAAGPVRLVSLRPGALQREMARVPEIGLAMLRLLTRRIRANDERLAALHSPRADR